MSYFILNLRLDLFNFRTSWRPNYFYYVLICKIVESKKRCDNYAIFIPFDISSTIFYIRKCFRELQEFNQCRVYLHAVPKQTNSICQMLIV